MEVCLEDLFVKSSEPKQHILDLQEAFDVLRHYKMKLNPIKCTFGVWSSKFLGLMVSEKGIKAKPKKIQMIIEMKSP